MKYRKYSKEFKLSVLAELESGKSIAQICSEKNIKSDVIYKWKSTYQKNPEKAFSGKGDKYSLESEIEEYKRLIGQLYAENAFLKRVQKNLKIKLSDQKVKNHRGYLK